ncbi:sulfotransferase family protein [Marinicauda sp. Alg238-R41]|uniref:sulfotransferase family protein n=1 Tax=Marinicauda sp. Alg238-R41 TaxID=2993447 RepID=UPI0022DF9595|nr:sulfotransferase [Marinicauda sp. Alg238-R41]
MTAALPGSPIFVGGAPRSGTTLLRALLNATGSIYCGPELRVIPSLCSLSEQIKQTSLTTLSRQAGIDEAHLNGVFARAISGFLSGLSETHAGQRIAEKTPANALHFKELRQLFPSSPLITVIRDGRDVVASLLKLDWTDARTGQPMDIVTDPAAAARLWQASVHAAEDMADDGQFHQLRYEDLARSPDATLSALFAFLGEEVDPATLDHTRIFRPNAGENETSAERVAQPIDKRAIGRWREDLTAGQLQTVEAIIGPDLRRLGYE